MRVLVTGSRDWTDKEVMWEALLDFPVSVLSGGHTLVHGAARGADTMAEGFCKLFGWEIESHPANWDDCGNKCGPDHMVTINGRTYCKRAGFERNKLMVSLGADVCLAFIKDDSRGATMCAGMAERAGIPVRYYRI